MLTRKVIVTEKEFEKIWKYEQVYDENDNMIRRYDYVKEEGESEWVLSGINKMKFIYIGVDWQYTSENGWALELMECEGWNYEYNKYNYINYEYEYDLDNRKATMYRKKYNTETEEWKYRDKAESFFDEKGKMVEEHEYFWDDEAQKWDLFA